uniref:Peptidase A2 domain-containing protein n=1 Tax=Globodera pallida TaxID=36090 RepID=A0A183CEB5_GLOPA
MTQPNIDQLIKLLTQQQQQMDQQQKLAAITVPALPDVSLFEPSDEKSRVTEWLDRFKFALDCAAPAATDPTKVKCLMNKMSELAFSEYSRSVLPAVVTDFDFATTIQKLEKLFAKPQSIFIDSDAALRQRILVKLAADGTNVRYDGVVEDLINYQSTISEARALEVPNFSRNVNVVQQKRDRTPQPPIIRPKKAGEPPQSTRNVGGVEVNTGLTIVRTKQQNAVSASSPGTSIHNATACKHGENKGTQSRVISVEILLNQKPVHVYLDTGSDANVIDERTYTKIGRPSITKCTEQEFYVAKSGSLNLLSCEAMVQIKGTTGHIEDLKKAFPDVFGSGLGLCTKERAHLTLKDDARPVYRKARPVPYSSREIVERELDRLTAPPDCVSIIQLD